MGKQIVYCSDCGRSLREADFLRGMANWIDEMPFCTGCRDVEPAAPAPPLTESSRAVRKSGAMPRVPRVKPKSSKMPLLIGVGGGALLLLIIIVAAASSGGEAPPTVMPPRPPPVEYADEDLEEDRERKEAAAKVARATAALKKARDFARSNPGDLDQRIVLYRQAKFLATGTKLEIPATRELEAVEREGRRTLEKGMANVMSQVRTAVAKEQFTKAIDILEAARKDPALADRVAELEEEIRLIRSDAKQAFTPLRDEGMEARRKGDEAAVERIRERLAGWGLKGVVEEFDGWLGTVTPDVASREPELSPEEKTFREGMALASGLHFARAMPAFEKDARPEAKTVLSAAREAEAFLTGAVQAMAKWPSGKALAVGYRTPTGGRAKVEGPVLRANDLEIVVDSQGTPYFIPLGEVLASTLAEASATKGRAAGLLCLFEGDVEAAKRFFPSLPPAFLEYGRKAASMEEPAAEAGARQRFYQALRASFDPLQSKEVQRLAHEILAQFGDSGFVARNRAAVEALKKGPQEYFITAGDLDVPEGFARAKTGRVGAALVAQADGASSIPVAFSLPAGMRFQAWAYVGGCCRETLAFTLEGTEVRARSVTPGLLTMKRRHAEHGGEKNPSDWVWAKLPTPRFYSSAGLKRLSFTSAHRGFALGCVLLSGTRASAPTGDALALEARLHRSPVRFDPSAHADLIAYWPLDEGDGGIARDATGHGHDARFAGAPKWVEGRKGGGIEFDGRGSFLKVPDHPDLTPAAFTMAAWVKLPAKPSAVANVFSKGHNEGIRWRTIGDGRVEVFDRGLNNVFISNGRVSPGSWTHLAVTADAAGLRAYIDGVPAGGSSRPYGGARRSEELYLGGTREFEEFFVGTLDELYFFKRALTGEEIQALRGHAIGEVGVKIGAVSAPPPAPEAAGTKVDVKSGRPAEWFSLSRGEKVYTDRDYTIESFPDRLKGAKALRASNDDKKSTGAELLSFEVPGPVTVHVAHDDRVAPKPAWLSSFTKTAGRMTINGSSDSGSTLYSKEFPAGRVVLGGNQVGDSSDTRMYTVIVVPK